MPYQEIDLHMHTTVSDGTDRPTDLLKLIMDKGIDLFSVTDHDGILGCSQILDELSSLKKEAGEETDRSLPGFITGVEFSCRDSEGKYHILGYGYDPEAGPINEVVDYGRQIRVEKVSGRLRFLEEEFGFTFSPEEKEELFNMYNPGKPHIANLMLAHGYAGDRKEAFTRYLNKKKFPNMFISPQDAIRGILDSGGIPVLAHPVYGSGDDLIMGQDMENRLRHLMEMGLAGVEGYYSTYTKKMHKEILDFADRFGLYVTAGSDYHGSNKLIELGENGLDEDPEGTKRLERFLNDVTIR